MHTSSRFSILICTLVERKESFRKLLDVLYAQTTSDVEILFECDNREKSTGEKRNILLERATGDYISFVDDDDLVSEDYIPKVLTALEESPDCCSLQGEITMTEHYTRSWNRVKRIFLHSLEYTSWYKKDNIYYRNPNHLNAVRRDLALQVKFPYQIRGEDKSYSKRLLPLLKTEAKIEGTIYHYFAS